jgi:NADP-dependent 3-hydroxy acid dehydrogenase YdfG
MTIMSTTDGFSRTALEAAKMNGSQDGKVFVITGAYSGIGVETTKALLEVGGKVIIGGRNEANL